MTQLRKRQEVKWQLHTKQLAAFYPFTQQHQIAMTAAEDQMLSSRVSFTEPGREW